MEKTCFLKDPVGGQSVVNKIVDNITNAIINGELNPGDKIPTEAELAPFLRTISLKTLHVPSNVTTWSVLQSLTLQAS